MLMNAALIFPKDMFSADLCPIAMDYAVWVYNWFPDIKSVLSAL